MIALFLAALMLLTFAACAKEEPEKEQKNEPQTAATEPDEAEPAAQEPQKEPEEEEVVVVGEPEKPDSKPEIAPENPLSDGVYLVRLEREQELDRKGTLWAGFILLQYVELPDTEISALKPGDTVQLPEYSFVIDNMRTDDSMGVREILFNDGTERCFCVEATNTWRFTWPNDEPYLTEGAHSVMPLAIDVILTDELTPLAEGKNVYGVRYDENDATIGALDLLEDFFKHYPGQESEQATITVKNGEIAEVLIEYHP